MFYVERRFPEFKRANDVIGDSAFEYASIKTASNNVY